MSSTLTREEVRRIAALAHLELTEAEVDLFAGQLTAILGYAAEVQQIDTTGVTPTSHAWIPVAPWRDDEPAPGLNRDDAFANAPDASREAGLFRVPKVL